MSILVKLRKERRAELQVSTNADDNADVQMVYSIDGATVFLDFTLGEAEHLCDALGNAIVAERVRQKKNVGKKRHRKA